MFPVSALRETIILVIFGIVLVPIAAKRAHDAPGYWQTFPRQLTYNVSESSSTSDLEVLRFHGTILPANQLVNENQSIPALYPTRSAPQTDTKALLTIHFHATRAKDISDTTTTTATTGSSEMAQATSVSKIGSTAAQQPTTAKTSTITDASEASKGRWTLIWMGCAITAVAVFMASC